MNTRMNDGSGARTLLRAALALGVTVTLASGAGAAIFDFNLQGNAGTGLLRGNENGVVNGTTGSGGEIGAGIFYNDVTNILTLNVGWGSGNGFTNLSGPATAGHLHGLTPSAAPASFMENAVVRYPLDSLPGWNTSATNGGFIGTLTIMEADEAALLAGRLYFNTHTSLNTGGEIRGNLVLVPTPAAGALAGLAGMLAARRRR